MPSSPWRTLVVVAVGSHLEEALGTTFSLGDALDAIADVYNGVSRPFLSSVSLKLTITVRLLVHAYLSGRGRLV